MGNDILRMDRKEIAADTLRILEQGFFQTPKGETIAIADVQKKAEENTTLYTPEESDTLLTRNYPEGKFKTEITITTETTLDAVRRLVRTWEDNILCLNFASAKNAGGGFLSGSQAQEESIARSTGLYPCLLRCPEYYEANKHIRSCIYTDHMIYSPSVPVIKTEDGATEHALKTVSILTAPAVNAGVVRRQEPGSVQYIEPVMKRRIEKVLAISLQRGHEVLVLGAWGCGVFQNNPDDIAQYFYDALNGKFKNQFRKVVFAIYSREEHFIQPFRRLFSTDFLRGKSQNTVLLYRPVGPKELQLIKESNWTAFPPRLPDQPIFYPVLNEEYAIQIARDWNVQASGSGFVTKFEMDRNFVSKYAPQNVGASMHNELWVPAEELDEFNKHIIGKIEVTTEFTPESVKGE